MFMCDSLDQISTKSSKSLLAIAVGVKQKVVVDQIVKKVKAVLMSPAFYGAKLCYTRDADLFYVHLQFPLSNFTIMLFHYDGSVDGWRDLQWSDSAVHVSALNQTKWWKHLTCGCIISQLELRLVYTYFLKLL